MSASLLASWDTPVSFDDNRTSSAPARRCISCHKNLMVFRFRPIFIAILGPNILSCSPALVASPADLMRQLTFTDIYDEDIFSYRYQERFDCLSGTSLAGLTTCSLTFDAALHLYVNVDGYSLRK